jgi:endoglucanase
MKNTNPKAAIPDDYGFVVKPPVSYLFKETPGTYYSGVLISGQNRNILFALAIILAVCGVLLFRHKPRLKLRMYTGIIIAVSGLIIATGTLYLSSPASIQTRIFSPYTLLSSSWENYKTRFIGKDGRVIDYTQGDITTSEAQSYALLQAVWIDDKSTYDLVWLWTKNNLTRKTDQLFGWRWGKLADGSYGFITNGGNNSASDADTDIVLSLILAGRRWNDSNYTLQAVKILPDLWNIDTDTLGSNRYLVAGNWAKGETEDVINPSYFAPYAWRLFAAVDTKDDWNSLITPAYALLNQATDNNLDKNSSSGLPPDWIAVRRTDAALGPAAIPGFTTNYSYDAYRIPWRVALDYYINKDPEARGYLNKLVFLNNYFAKNNQLPSGFTHDGDPLNSYENPAMYATALADLTVENPSMAEKVFQEKIVKLYSNDTNSFRQDLSYYDTNWLWFGSGLYLHYLSAF